MPNPAPLALPAHPNLDWLRKAARRRLAELRAGDSAARLHQAQLAVARDYGFRSWRALKAHIDAVPPAAPAVDAQAVLAAARAGDAEAVRRAFAAGFDPATPDGDGRTIFQIAKELCHEAVEQLARDVQGGRPTRREPVQQALQDIAAAAKDGDLAALAARLAAHPDLINERAGRGFFKATPLHLAARHNRPGAIRLLIERGADVDAREFPGNATPLHFAAMYADLDAVRLLVEAGADVDGRGTTPASECSAGPPASRRCARTWPPASSPRAPRSTCGRRSPSTGRTSFGP